MECSISSLSLVIAVFRLWIMARLSIWLLKQANNVCAHQVDLFFVLWLFLFSMWQIPHTQKKCPNNLCWPSVVVKHLFFFLEFCCFCFFCLTKCFISSVYLQYYCCMPFVRRNRKNLCNGRYWCYIHLKTLFYGFVSFV